MCFPTKRVRGFTLIEVLFGITLLGVAATAFAAMYPISARLQASARNRAQAARIAQREMESLRRLPFGNLVNIAQLQIASPAVIDTSALTPPYSFTNIAADGSNTVASLLPSGTGTVMIEDVSATDPSAVSLLQTNLRRLTVTVSWDDRGKTRSVVVSSLVSYLEAPKK